MNLALAASFMQPVYDHTVALTYYPAHGVLHPIEYLQNCRPLRQLFLLERDGIEIHDILN